MFIPRECRCRPFRAADIATHHRTQGVALGFALSAHSGPNAANTAIPKRASAAFHRDGLADLALAVS